jgi:hypothetical protein
LGTEGARAAILRDLKKRGSGWLFPAVKRMASMLLADWEGWTEAFRK